jgi:hypothetical protein
MLQRAKFTHDNKTGYVDKEGFVLWAGLGFQFEAAKNNLKTKILEAAKKAGFSIN